MTVTVLGPRIQQWTEKTKTKHPTERISYLESLHSNGGRETLKQMSKTCGMWNSGKGQGEKVSKEGFRDYWDRLPF